MTTRTRTHETVSTDDWEGPFVEPNAHGGYTGEMYVRCSDCGIEVLEGHTDAATHCTGCSNQ